jgi:hypothetical protein
MRNRLLVLANDVLCKKLHAMFFRNMKYEDFAKQLTDVSMSFIPNQNALTHLEIRVTGRLSASCSVGM